MADKLRSLIRGFLHDPHDPGFLIIGAQKCATTSLHAYLRQHKDLRGAKPKEIHYFDRDIHAGKTLEQYRQHFVGARGKCYYESSPSYLYAPGTAREIHAAYPDIKLVAVLRDPVKRAYSAWNHYKQLFENGKYRTLIGRGMRREGSLLYARFYEGRKSFPAFRECIDIELELMESGAGFEPALLRRGLYLDQLEVYWRYFPARQMLILGFQDVIKDTATTLARVAGFLGVRDVSWNASMFKAKNSREYCAPIREEDRLFLEDFYERPNRALFDAVGKLNW
jgi:hypothetical protein